MTVVKEDARGLYVVVGDRVGRPATGEHPLPGELKPGQEVRAMALPDQSLVRVRYAGGEHHWEMHVGRRTGGKTPPLKFAVGQTWLKRNGASVKITKVAEVGDVEYRKGHRAYPNDGGWRYADGRLHEKKDMTSSHDLMQLVKGE